VKGKVDLQNIKTGLIINPHAARMKKKYYKNQRFWENLHPQDNVKVTPTEDGLKKAILDLSGKGIKYLVVLGGDGTIRETLTVLLNSLGTKNMPIVVPLRGGNQNQVTINLKLRKPAHILFEKFLTAASREAEEGVKIPLSAQRLLKIEDELIEQPFYGFTLTNGAIYRAISAHFSRPDPGFFDLIKTTLKPLSELWFNRRKSGYFEPVEMEITKGNELFLNDKVCWVIASVVENATLGYSLFDRPLKTLPGYHCIINTLPMRKIFGRFGALLHFVSLARGKSKFKGHFNRILSEPITITSSYGYSLDGELFHRWNRYKLRISPGPVFHYPIL
jgi:diacylglycerol kinase family enzyme